MQRPLLMSLVKLRCAYPTVGWYAGGDARAPKDMQCETFMKSDTATPTLILASASPRRQELLRDAGYRFTVIPADIDESDFSPALAPAAVAELLARRKAEWIADRAPESLILAADTVVALGPMTLGKPIDADDARRILSLLSGTHHEVITAVRIICQSRSINLSRIVVSSVFMKPLSAEEVSAYLATGLWEGKAGAYGIQDHDPFVTRIEGSLTNIVGLPMDEVREMIIRAHGE